MKLKLLLHACCAPCSTSVYENLCSDFDLTVYWYNPNIFPEVEHNKRLKEIKKLSKLLNFKLIIDSDSAKDHQKWLEKAKKFSKEKEAGKRCTLCYDFRLQKVFDYAKKHKYDYFTTTLTVSPYKNAPKIIECGKKLERSLDSAQRAPFGARDDSQISTVKFLDKDFKKNDGYSRSLELSKKYDLYRQNYCGCEFSIKNS